MKGQLIHNWDDIYQGDNVPPWEDLEPNHEFLSLIQSYCSPGMKILEIGSGLGHNALALYRMGFDVTASDYSENAVQRFVEMTQKEGVSIKYRVLDIMSLQPNAGTYDLVFDKGCWHSFFEPDARNRYVDQIFSLLNENGIWVNASGSADNIDDPNDSNLDTYPRWSLGELIQGVESCFEVLQVRKGKYGYTKERDFLTWEVVSKKRKKG